MARQKRPDLQEIVSRCGFFAEFIGMRYTERPSYDVHVPPGPEKTFYYAQSFCGIIDSDGIDCLLVQSAVYQRRMYRSVRELGLDELVENAERAEAALKRAGLSLRREKDWDRASKVLRRYNENFFVRLRPKAYRRLLQFSESHVEFLPYALNCLRMDKQGGNPFNPKEWTEKKLQQAKALYLREQRKS